MINFKAAVDFITNNYSLWITSKIILILVISSLLHIVINKLIQILPKIIIRYHKFDLQLLELLANATLEPIIFLLWGISTLLILECISQSNLIQIKYILFLFCITWLIFRVLTEGEKYIMHFVYKGEQKVDRRHKTTIIAINRICKIIVVMLVVLLIMDSFNINITGIVALGSASTIVLGLAGKELIANFFGGMMIFMDRQFMVGDLIRLVSQDIEGKVEYIGWRLTKIRTLENALLYVPNSTFLTISIENDSKRHTRRIKEIIKIKYKDWNKIAPVLEDLKRMLKDNPDLSQNEICFIGIYQFNNLAIDCLLCCFTKVVDLEDYLTVKHSILSQISEILLRYDMDCTTASDLYKIES